MEQLSINDTPTTPRARRTDPDTSHEAAGSVKNISDVQRGILEVIRLFGPIADHNIRYYYEAQADLGNVPACSDSGLRTRRKELQGMGLIEDSGLRFKTPTGRLTIAWVVTPR